MTKGNAPHWFQDIAAEAINLPLMLNQQIHAIPTHSSRRSGATLFGGTRSRIVQVVIL